MEIDKKSLKKVLFCLILAILIEVFICNYPAFRTIIHGNYNQSVSFQNDNNTILIEDVGIRVTSIKIKYKNELLDKITYNVKYISEGNSDLISLNSKIILPEQNQCIQLDTQSNCKKIEIELITENEVYIDEIRLNSINFSINILRLLLIYIIISIIELIHIPNVYGKKLEEYSKKQDIDFIIKILFLFTIIVVYTILEYNTESFFINKTDINHEDSLLMQTESFMNGKIELLEEPSNELKNMENPYDHVKRNENNVPYLYDVAYYDGAYYNYFGVAPIITCILPFRVITGGYTHCYIFNLIYILGIMISLYYFYKKLVFKYLKNISYMNFELGYLAILFGCNVLTLLRGAKYDIVITSGLMFLLISLNLAIRLYDNYRFNSIKLVFIGISLALCVLSKPTFIFYYILVLFIVLDKFKNLNLKEKIIDGLKIVIPLIVFGIFQMILNYLRFENIFEFGAKYQLTSFNMINCMKISFGKILAGFLEYIFRIPIINPMIFPFVFINTNTSLVSANEVLYENRLYGLIGIPILWIFFFKNSFVKKEDGINRFIKYSLICVCLEIIANTCFGGICEAYAIDFKLILCINSVLLFLKFIEDDDYEKNIIFAYTSIITILLMIPISLTTELLIF